MDEQASTVTLLVGLQRIGTRIHILSSKLRYEMFVRISRITRNRVG